MATRMQQRRGTAAQWISTNSGNGPILNAGEIGWESDTNKFKIGDGVNTWLALDYFSDTNSTVNPAFGSSITFEGATANNFETTLAVTDPTADRTITFPDATGTVALTGTNVSFNNITATGDLSVTGDLTVSGTTTSINTSTLEVEDKNILIAKVDTSTISATGNIASFTGADPFAVTITGLTSTTGVVAGMNITATNGTGGFGTSSNSITVASVPSATSIVATQSGGNQPTVGTITSVIVSGSDVTADGAGLTVQGTTNKTFNWVDSTNAFTSSENIAIANGKTFNGNLTGDVTGNLTGNVTGNTSGSAATLATSRNINGVSFNGSADITVTAAAGTLSGDTLNSSVTTSSLTALGTVTTGTWSASTIALNKGGTGATTQAGAANAVLPSQAGNADKVLKTDGTNVSFTSTPSFTGLTVSTNDLDVGSQSDGLRTTDGYTNPMAVFSIDADDDYAQLAVKNTGNGVNSSTDIIAYSNNGDDTSGWIDMGITSDNFADAGFTITGTNDGYVFLEAPIGNLKSINNKALTSNVATLTTSAAHGYSVGDEVVITEVGSPFDGTYIIATVPTSTTFTYAKTATNVTSAAVSPVGQAKVATGNGNLVLATGGNGTRNKIVFAAGGLSSDNSQMEITPDVNVHIEIPTPSTSSTTGALTVVGGVGIQGDMNIQGDVSIEGTITFGGAGTTVETANLSVTDPIIFTGDGNTADIVDLGLVGEYKVGANTKYAGLVRDASDGSMKIFKDATTKPTTTINFAEAGLSYSDLQVGGLTATSASIGDVSNTELQYLNNVSSNIQTQLDAKLATATAASTYAPLASPVFTGTVSVPTSIEFEGSSADSNETTLTVANPTADRTITLPDATGTVSLLTNTETLTNKTLTAPSLTGTTKVQQLLEKATVSATAATGTINYDLLTNGSVTYYTSNASANWTLNLRGDGSTTLNSVMATGEALTIAFLVTQATAYYSTAFQVDGSAITPKWQDGTAPSSGNASSIDIYTYTVIKTGNAAFTAFASRTKFA